MDDGGPTGKEDLFTEAKRELKPLAFRVYPVVLALVIATVVLGSLAGLERWQLFVDPAEELQSVLVGAFSNLGVLLWWTTVVVTGFTWLLLRRDGKSSDVKKMLGATALLSAYLAMDDLFLLHDYVFPESLHVPEGLVMGATLLAAAAFFWRFRDVFLRSSDRLVLLVALLFLCASLAVDASPGEFGKGTLEDAFKFVGIATWLTYFATVSASLLQAVS
jgi:hypothetical protein